jgi:hypothetical protein
MADFGLGLMYPMRTFEISGMFVTVLSSFKVNDMIMTISFHKR